MRFTFYIALLTRKIKVFRALQALENAVVCDNAVSILFVYL
jgi:hypothetical protein